MSLKDWERDVINRQRNIVFPDTVLNEGRMFRNLASSGASTPVQRIGLLLISAMFIIGGGITLAYSLGTLISVQGSDRLIAIIELLPSAGILVFGIALCMKGFFPAKPQPTSRRD